MLEFYWIGIGIGQFEFTEIGIGLGEWNFIFVSIWNQNCHSMSGIRSAIKHLGEIGIAIVLVELETESKRLVGI